MGVGMPKAKKKQGAKKVADASLHKAFIKGLALLEKFWQKRTSQLEKQLKSYQTKLKKETSKKSPSKKNCDLLLHEITEINNAASEAALSLNKYLTLRKLIEQFEAKWIKKGESGFDLTIIEETITTAEPDEDLDAVLEATLEAELEEELEDELDIDPSLDEEISELEVIEDFSSKFLEEDDTFDEDYA